jgi:hypothetical protein
MKPFSLKILILFSALFLFTTGNKLLSQTAGNFVFSVTTTSTGGYSPKHLIAIWIESSAPSFVKTKIMYCGANFDHLATWTSRTGSNLVDATTGATLATHGTVSFIWNGTDVSGNIVPDGTYNVWVEMAWAASLTTGKTVAIYSFTKGTNSFSLTPANTANFYGINLTWTPSGTTSIESEIQDKEIRVFPNPTKGLLNIDFKTAAPVCLVQVINETGVLVFTKSFKNVPAGITSLDLDILAPGQYFVTIHVPGRDTSFRIIRIK